MTSKANHSLGFGGTAEDRRPCAERVAGPAPARVTGHVTSGLEYPADRARLPGQLAQQLLGNPHYVVFSVILAS
jgi:hypothetical protein